MTQREPRCWNLRLRGCTNAHLPTNSHLRPEGPDLAKPNQAEITFLPLPVTVPAPRPSPMQGPGRTQPQRCCHASELACLPPDSSPSSVLHVSARVNFRQSKFSDLGFRTNKSFMVHLTCIRTKFHHLLHSLFQLIPAYLVGVNKGSLPLPPPPTEKGALPGWGHKSLWSLGHSSICDTVGNDPFACQHPPVDRELAEDRPVLFLCLCAGLPVIQHTALGRYLKSVMVKLYPNLIMSGDLTALLLNTGSCDHMHFKEIELHSF